MPKSMIAEVYGSQKVNVDQLYPFYGLMQAGFSASGGVVYSLDDFQHRLGMNDGND